MRYRVFIFTLMPVCLLAQSMRSIGPKHFVTKEAALGSVLADQVRRQTTALGDARIMDDVTAIGLRLAKQMPSDEDWKFAVIKDSAGASRREPIGLPGGSIFVPAGLILAANDEAEFAGMLAHAMAHVVNKDGIRSAPAGQTTNLAAIPITFVCWPGALSPVSCLTPLRSREIAADRRAARAMAAAGYSPEALLRYISRTQVEYSPGEEKFSRLPTRAERAEALERFIESTPEPRQPVRLTDFAELQRKIRTELDVPWRGQSLSLFDRR